MKKNYLVPELEVTVLGTSDIILASDGNDTYIDAGGALDPDANV